MKLIPILSLALVVLFSACSTTKNAKKDLKISDYACEIVLYDNQMPGPTPRTDLYAHVILKSSLEKNNLEENWKIQSFMLNKENYADFDSIGFEGKGEESYVNNIRGIKKAQNEPIHSTIVFINEKGKTLTFDFQNLEIIVVH